MVSGMGFFLAYLGYGARECIRGLAYVCDDSAGSAGMKMNMIEQPTRESHV